jgi:L-arabinose isomerase
MGGVCIARQACGPGGSKEGTERLLRRGCRVVAGQGPVAPPGTKGTRIKPPARPRVGLYSIGHPQYWVQFPGLRERLLAYGDFIATRLAAWAEVVPGGLVDADGPARAATERFQAAHVDLLFCHAATYAPSAAHLAVARRTGCPVVVLNLQPAPRMDYARTDTAEWLAQCVACTVPEIANAFRRSGVAFHAVHGLLGMERTLPGCLADEVTAHRPEALRAWTEIREWVAAAGVARTLRQARLGFLGHVYPGMLDMYTDFTTVEALTGAHVEILEMCDLAAAVERVTPEEVARKRQEALAAFDLPRDVPADPLARPPTAEQLDWACQVAAAQERLVRTFDLDALTYYYRGAPGNAYERLQEAFILGHSLLTGCGIPCAGEGDIKTGIAMKIADCLDVGGSYCEIVATDFVDGTLLLGHDGPFHPGIAAGRPVLRGMGMYHGKWGSGISVEAQVRPGPISTLGIAEDGAGGLQMVVTEGTSTAGPILHIGNTMTPVRFAVPPADLMDRWFALGPTHHFALTVGHNAGLFRKVAALLGWPCQVVTGAARLA